MQWSNDFAVDIESAMLRSVGLDEIFDHKKCLVVDVRSPSEFEDSHIPGAVSLPLLFDQERAEIGTLYKRKSAAAALARALEIFNDSFDQKIKDFQKILDHKGDFSNFEEAVSAVRKALYVDGDDVRFSSKTRAAEKSEIESADRPIVFYCWRGGARSKSMALFFQTLGWDVFYLEKGHKEFRRRVLEYLEASKYPFQLCTLYGLTGCGKTKILEEWALEGKPVIDLEGLAHHRGSAFGQIGMSRLGQQKDFENNLYWQMRRWEKARVPLVYVEGESRRIGRCQLPERFMKAMHEGQHIKIEKSLEERVEHILKEYVAPIPRSQWQKEALRSLESIKKRLGGEKFQELQEDLLAGRDRELIHKLLVDYYDKAYLFSRSL